MKLKIPFFRQNDDFCCGPASLQMAFAFFKKFENQKKLERKAKTSHNGTTHKNMINLALKGGFYCYVNENSNILEIKDIIKSGLPVIVNFIEPSENEGHYAVVSGFAKSNIVLNDPWNGRNFKMPIQDFEKRWYYIFEKHKYPNWLMAISKKDFKIDTSSGRKYNPK